jgi:RimJ/RimL family protein N-acetyltransferase
MEPRPAKPYRLAAPIRTERLTLRRLRDADFEPLCRIHGSADVARWLMWEPREPAAVRVALDRKMRETQIAGTGDALSLAIELDGALIGDCVLWMTSMDDLQGELGYILDPEHQGQGYATEAAAALLRIAFEELRLHRVVGRIEPRNTGSGRVLERIGMRREALLIENEFVKGEWQSEAIYAILDREWRGRTRGA